MQTITLKINDNIFDKFQWLLNHFSKNEISIVNDIDTTKFSKNNFDYISVEKLNQLKSISSDYKNGNKDDFEEYTL